ncbi:DUF427 domain-containing protein [Hansschlegelia quercus]|uniref:DUF427 domain-containing protein n=1 Tax=Hansschlegelia quercus TaxID=2528245 RepID=A0A4Q9GKK1_9HYPH|nr:DUF427 domain-containing protein [Hansschlegelia quercus]TBN54738.1 DUF427 domain-containing protein [Hansschlegelia quercus]
MTTAAMKTPGPDHPISMELLAGRVIVTAGGKVIADSANALILREASYPPVYYIPRADADMTLLQRSPRTSHCPYKGDAAYFSIPAAGPRGTDAVWTYEETYPAVSPIAGHLAFYPDRVDAIEIRQEP